MATAAGRDRVERFGSAPALWLLALVLFGVGDVATTVVGLTRAGLTELHPLAASLIEQYGVLVLLPLKAGVLACFYAGWRWTPFPYATGIPIALALVGASVTLWNGFVLAVAAAA